VVPCINLPVDASLSLCYRFLAMLKSYPVMLPRYLELLAILMPKLGARLYYLPQSTPSDLYKLVTPPIAKAYCHRSR
jgi:hypothetical protein